MAAAAASASATTTSAASGDPRSMPRLANAILDQCLASSNPGVDATSTPVLWNSAMLAWAKAPAQNASPGPVQQVMALLARMKELGVQPTQVTYATVLQALSGVVAAGHATSAEGAAAGSPVKAHKKRRAGQAHADVPEDPQLQVARDVYGKLVHKVLDEAERNLDLEPNDVCYLHALQTLVHCRRLDDAHSLLQSRVAKYRESAGGGDAPATATTTTTTSGASSSREAAGQVVERRHTFSVPGTANKPSRHMFGVVMSGFARQGDVDKVVGLFRDLLSLHGATEGERRECLTTVNMVLHALAEAGTVHCAQQAQELLERVAADAAAADSENGRGGSGRMVDTACYNTVLHAWAVCAPKDPHRCVESAEALLQAIPYPNMISYTNVIKAWSRSDIRSPPAAERCVSFLDAMWEHHKANSLHEPSQSDSFSSGPRLEDGLSSVKPNAITYAIVLYAWSRSRDPRAPLEAERLFTDMLNRYQNGDDDMQPTEAGCFALLMAWNRSDNRELAASRIQFNFDQWVEHCRAHGLVVSRNVYYIVMQSKTRAGDGVGAERLLEDIVDTYRVRRNGDDRGDQGACLFERPSHDTFHLVMRSIVNANDALDRLDRMISQMKELEETHGWHDLKPKSSILVLLLQALADSRRFLAAERATRILNDMESSQDPDMRPTPQCYAEVLSAWDRSRQPDAAERTQALFQDMLKKYQAGDDSCRLNSKAYATVLSSYSYSDNPEAPLKALSLLNELDDLHQRYGDKYERPNTFHYSSVINTFAERGDVENARAVLDRMQRRSKRDGVEPSTGCFNGLIKAIVKSGAADAGEQAEEVLRRTMPPSGLGSADVTTYTICISAWQHSDKPDAADRAERLLRECMRVASESRKSKRAELQPNAKTFLAYVRVVLASRVKDKADRVKRVVSLMKQLNVKPSYDLRLALHEAEGLEAK
jgi:pentatricopeptide repeat protein